MRHGIFVISLDFELAWGISGAPKVNAYRQNILGVCEVVPQMLALFQKYDVHITWATVGFLFAANKEELLPYMPFSRPSYQNPLLSSYMYFEKESLVDEALLFNKQLFKKIQNTPHQEIASHTFSHYYCLEKGQTVENFYQDMSAAQAIAGQKSIDLKSFVFPRNQYNEAYLSVIQELGFLNYRGNQNGWMYQAANQQESFGKLKKFLRFIDAYFNISGYHTYVPQKSKIGLFNLSASQFLRPYLPRLKQFEKLKIRRIKKGMLKAAQTSTVFHLWWHPHNFGVNQKENLKNLEIILQYYEDLRKTYNLRSLTMKEVCELYDRV